MKKLITAAVASAFAFLAMGAANAVELPSGTSLENLTAGEALDPTKNDSGTGSDSTYWFLAGDERAELLVSNYVAASYQPRPEQFTGDNNNYLKIDTNGRLYRSVGVNSQTLDSFPTAEIGDGIYLDTLVQFTAADDEFKEDAIATGDKIAIEYVEREEERDGDDNITVTAMTNFVVRAAYVDAANLRIVATNYYLTFPGQSANAVQFDKTAWHRLTVRAISNVGNAYAPVGFVVYVDGTNLVYDASVAAGDEAYVGSLNSVVKTYLYNSETHALLPSLLRYGETGYDTLSAVAFNGNGCVDDISFTDQTPGFIGRTVTFDLGTGDAVTTLTVAGVDYDVAGVATTNIENLVETFTIAVTPAENYNISVISNIEGCTYASTTPTSGIVTLTAASATVKVITTRDNFDYTDENGDPQTAVTLTDAFANVGAGQTISLKFDYNVADWEGEDFGGFVTGSGEYFLDLNGHVLNGGDDGIGVSLITVYGALTIIDSQGNGGIIYDTIYGEGAYGIVANTGDAYIGAVAGDKGATFTGQLFEPGYDGYVVKGQFDVTYNSDGSDFLWEGCLESATADLNQEETYWVVTPDSTITYAIEWTLTGGATTASEGGFEENDTIEFTAESGKTLSFVSINGDEILNTSVYGDTSYTYTVGTEDAVLVVTFTEPAPTTYEVTWTLSGGTASATSGDDFAAGATIVFTADSGKTLSYLSIDGVEDSSEYGASSYTYTVGTADAVLEVTFSSSTYPSYIEDITDSEVKAAYEAKYDDWAEAYSVADGSTYQAAFLLNIDPAAADQTLKAASITMEGGKVVITANQTLTSVNGKVYVKVATTLAGLSTAEWAEATLSEGKVQVTPESSDTAGFYKIKVDF